MEDAKEVHSSLRRAAGLIKFVQVYTNASLESKCLIRTYKKSHTNLLYEFGFGLNILIIEISLVTLKKA